MRENRRRHTRIDDQLVFDYSILSPEAYVEERELFYKSPSGTEKVKMKYPFLSSKWLRFHDEDEEEETRFEKSLMELFVAIDEKLDRILSHLGSKAVDRASQLMSKEPVPVNISGSGMLFPERRKIDEGEFLKMEILIPVFPYFVIPVLAKVCRVEEASGGGYRIAVDFKDIHEDDRDTLIHYILSRQRRMLRQGRSKKG